MPYHMMQHFPLEAAYLCQDCNSVGNNSRNCPACASGVLMSLAGVLDREPAAHTHSVTYSFPLQMADVTSMVA